MTNRITNAHLQAIVDRLNRLTNSPSTSYSVGQDGRLRANVGNYHLSYAYGGVSLHRMANESGGVSSPLYSGHIPKRELAERLHAFIYGIQTAQQAMKEGEHA